LLGVTDGTRTRYLPDSQSGAWTTSASANVRIQGVEPCTTTLSAWRPQPAGLMREITSRRVAAPGKSNAGGWKTSPGRRQGGWARTTDLLAPNQALWPN